MTEAWNPDFYKTGYEGYDRLDRFPNRDAIEQYRSLLLQKTAEQVDFISRHLGRRKLRIIEFGSGNGRLLVGLAGRGLLEFGLGLEISRSRVQFAQQWIDDLGLQNEIRTEAADVLDYDVSRWPNFDLAICITGAFGYFRPIRESAPAQLLSTMRRSLHSHGAALLELYRMPRARLQLLTISDGHLRTWQPLPPQDRFAYYLDDLQYWAGRRILRHEKIFIGRDGTIDSGRVEMLAYYAAEELSQELKAAGFGQTQLYSDFDDSPYNEERAEKIVALAPQENSDDYCERPDEQDPRTV